MASKNKIKEIKKSSKALYAELDLLLGNKKKKEKVFDIIAKIIQLDLKKTKLKNKIKFNELLKELTPEFEQSADTPTPLKITTSKSIPAKRTRTRKTTTQSKPNTAKTTTKRVSKATAKPTTGSLALGAIAAASAVAKLNSVEEIKSFIKSDKRTTVLNRAKARIKSLESKG